MLKTPSAAKRRKSDSKVMLLTAVIHKENKWYVAECPEVGTASQGKTIESALANLKEATELYLEEFPIKNLNRPFLATFEAAYA
jgi:predicted RNase H-like HicB family nuclease